MKPTELRIGNLVLYEGKVVKVEQITKKKIGYHRYKGETRMNYARLQEVEPVPITGQLLLNNGFTYDENGCYYRDAFECSYDIYGNWYMSGNGNEYAIAPLDGVHDLQNAYNLVTKQELTLQL